MSISSPTSAADAVFGRSPLIRWVARSLNAADRLAPQLTARLALHLFFAPLPSKHAARRKPHTHWRQRRLALEHGEVAVLERVAASRPLGPRVLLVHGWAGDALQMQPLGEAFAAAGYEPLLLDMPAHGRSDGWRCTMPQIVDSLFAVERDLGPLHAVVAHSMGAVASLHAAAHGLPVGRLVVMAPSPPPRSVLRWFGEVFGLGDRLLERMRQRIETAEGMVLDEFEASFFGPRVAAPVLVIHDRADRTAPLAGGQALSQALPDSELLVIEGSSHRRMLADRRVIDAAVAHVSRR